MGVGALASIIHCKEASGALLGLSRASRDKCHHGKQVLSLRGNLRELLRFERVCARALELGALNRNACALQLVGDIAWRRRYVESERTPSDEASRRVDAEELWFGEVVRCKPKLARPPTCVVAVIDKWKRAESSNVEEYGVANAEVRHSAPFGEVPVAGGPLSFGPSPQPHSVPRPRGTRKKSTGMGGAVRPSVLVSQSQRQCQEQSRGLVFGFLRARAALPLSSCRRQEAESKKRPLPAAGREGELEVALPLHIHAVAEVFLSFLVAVAILLMHAWGGI